MKLALFVSFFPLVSSRPGGAQPGLLPQFDRPALFSTMPFARAHRAFCGAFSKNLWSRIHWQLS